MKSFLIASSITLTITLVGCSQTTTPAMAPATAQVEDQNTKAKSKPTVDNNYAKLDQTLYAHINPTPKPDAIELPENVEFGFD